MDRTKEEKAAYMRNYRRIPRVREKYNTPEKKAKRAETQKKYQSKQEYRERRKLYYLKRKELKALSGLTTYDPVYYNEHKDTIIGSTVKWQKKKMEHIVEYRKWYYKENKERLKQLRKEKLAKGLIKKQVLTDEQKENNRKKYEENKLEIAKQRREERNNNLEKYRSRQRRYYREKMLGMTPEELRQYKEELKQKRLSKKQLK